MGLHCAYCGCYHMTHEMAEGNCCIRCYNKREKNPLERFNPENDKTDKLRDERTMKPCELCKLPYSTELNKRYCNECQNVKNDVEGKGMELPVGTIKEYCIIDIVEGDIRLVKMEDYLKVVEEKQNLQRENMEMIQDIERKKKTFGNLMNDLIKNEELLKEKDDVILNRNKYIDILLNKVNDKDEEIEELEKQNEYYAKEYERLKDLYEPEPQYEEWCELKYWYEDVKTGDTKMYRQHMNYEEACELIGMDSDNWIEFNVVKYRKEVK